MRREDFMRRALALAEGNVAEGGGPFGAVVACGGEIVAEATNRVTASNDPTAHAEVEAIRAACRRLGRFHLSGCEIYTSCEPCPMCLGAVYWARLDRVWYAARREDAAAAGFSDQLIYQEIPLPPAERTIPAASLLPGEGARPFAAWEEAAAKIPY
ncbi:MAG TPA: nucleoside deaminase [Thermoanaerobaculia bacterium]|nr:nucleoside deaminase [Thermoanaerobaculia bacterium]